MARAPREAPLCTGESTRPSKIRARPCPLWTGRPREGKGHLRIFEVAAPDRAEGTPYGTERAASTSPAQKGKNGNGIRKQNAAPGDAPEVRDGVR